LLVAKTLPWRRQHVSVNQKLTKCTNKLQVLIMHRLSLIAVLVLCCPMLLAEDRSWPLESADSSELTVHGDIAAAPGGETTLSSMWRLRHGRSVPPRFPGAAKGKQWSYPYGHEHNGKLYVVYSIGKEECGLTIVPLGLLAPPWPVEPRAGAELTGGGD
jgi:hypothetical protein